MIMRKKVIFLFFLSTLFACKKSEETTLKEGSWRAQLKVMDGKVLPFNFALTKNGADYVMEIYNSEEVVKIDEIEIINDSIIIKMPVYEGYIAGIFTEKEIKGSYIKESLDRVVSFQAIFGDSPRFTNKNPTQINVSGIWEAEFSAATEDSYMAKGIFIQKDNKVTGTFRTATGDYRYLEGIADGDSLRLSTFDGAHAFLFTAKVTDSSLNGTFYSGNHFKEPFIGKRNESFELPDGDSLTYLREGYDSLEFSFPDSQGNVLSLNDQRFRNKVVIVQIMGTWCPNCLDETKFLTDFLEKNDHSDLEVVALAFEYAKTQEAAFKSIVRLKERIGVTYPVLLAQYGTSNKIKANEKLPMLNHVLSYPTTIFIDKKGEVRKIHTGFNGSATGDKYTEFKKEFRNFLNQLLAE